MIDELREYIEIALLEKNMTNKNSSPQGRNRYAEEGELISVVDPLSELAGAEILVSKVDEHGVVYTYDAQEEMFIPVPPSGYVVLDESELPKRTLAMVPRQVAKWFEECGGRDASIYVLLRKLESVYLKEKNLNVVGWVDSFPDDITDAQSVVAEMFCNGYIIKQEPEYVVSVEGRVILSGATKDEILAYDKRLWPFATPMDTGERTNGL